MLDLPEKTTTTAVDATRKSVTSEWFQSKWVDGADPSATGWWRATKALSCELQRHKGWEVKRVLIQKLAETLTCPET